MKKPKPQGLSKTVRLRNRWEFLRFFDGSEVFHLSHCTIFRIENGRPHFRVGITLKARGKSVDRNKTKRQVREAFRTHAEELSGFDYNVVIPQNKSLVYPYPEKLRQSLEQELVQISTGQIRGKKKKTE